METYANYIIECDPINSYMSELYNNINDAYSDSTGYTEAFQVCDNTFYAWCSENLGVNWVTYMCLLKVHTLVFFMIYMERGLIIKLMLVLIGLLKMK